MRKVKVLEVLAQFDQSELKKVAYYINSPLFNQNKKLSILLSACIETVQKLNTVNQMKQSVFLKLFPEQEYDDLKIRHLMSDLYDLICDYITLKKLRKDNYSQKKYLMEYFNEKDLQKHFKHVAAKYDAQERSSEIRNAGFYFDSIPIIGIKLTNTLKNSGRIVKDDNRALNEKLDIFYFLKKLEIICAEINNKNVIESEEHEETYESFFKYFNFEAYADHLMVKLYYQLYLVLSNPSEVQNFYNLKNSLVKNSHKIAEQEHRQFYFMLLNYCIRKINHGNAEFIKELFKIYKLAVEKDILLEDGYLSPWHFKNIISVSIRNSKLEWAKKFIMDYKYLLKKESRENAVLFNTARIDFVEERFKSAMQALQMVSLTDLFYALDAKALLLKTYYELEEFEAMDNLIISFLKMLRRKKVLSERHRKNYKNFIKYVKKASRLHYQRKSRVPLLIKEIEATKDIADKKWLLEKVKAFR